MTKRARCRRLAVRLGGLACLVAALGIAPVDVDVVPRLLRGATAPIVLPQLWDGVDAARKAGSLGETWERARTLVDYLPEWSDGAIHFAALLAFESSQRQPDVELALDRLGAAVAWLEALAASRPAHAGDLLCALASFVDLRTRQDEALGAAFTRRFGVPPLAAADRWLARAEAAAPLASTAQRRAWLALRQIASAFRSGDDARAHDLATLALARLAEDDTRLDVASFRNALVRARAAAAGQLAAEELQGTPLLADVAAALAERTRTK